MNDDDGTHKLRTFSSLTGSPQESSPKVYVGQGLFPDQGDETLPDDDDEEDEDERLSMVALETELQKYLRDD